MAIRISLALILALLTHGCATSGQVAAPPSSPEDAARDALRGFFAALHDRRYTDAVSLYGGPWHTMRDHNPSLPPNDFPALMRNACETNGASCLLPRTITLEQAISETEFRFLVEFQYDDGSVFIRGPCCGASPSDDPPQSLFPYLVVKDSQGYFLVTDMPPYTP